MRTLISLIFLFVAIPLYAAERSHLEIAKDRWEQEWREHGQEIVKQPYYPTEPALVWMSAYAITRDGKYAESARRQLDYAHTREVKQVIVAPEGATRDYQARQIYNFYVAYKVLGDEKYLSWADGCAKGMIDLFARKEREIAGEKHTVFTAGFIDVNHPAEGSLGYFIDVNQNAEGGLAFGLLYHEPKSRFFNDPKAKEIAFEETLASMAVQDRKTGAIPIGEGEWIDKFDTAYGAYGAMSWVWSAQLWHDAKMDEHVKAAGKWLGSKKDLLDGNEHWWPKHIAGEMKEWEAWYRIPLYWHCGIESSKFMDDVFDAVGKAESKWQAPWTIVFYEQMGVPREFYLNQK